MTDRRNFLASAASLPFLPEDPDQEKTSQPPPPEPKPFATFNTGPNDTPTLFQRQAIAAANYAERHGNRILVVHTTPTTYIHQPKQQTLFLRWLLQDDFDNLHPQMTRSRLEQLPDQE